MNGEESSAHFWGVSQTTQIFNSRHDLSYSFLLPWHWQGRNDCDVNRLTPFFIYNLDRIMIHNNLTGLYTEFERIQEVCHLQLGF